MRPQIGFVPIVLGLMMVCSLGSAQDLIQNGTFDSPPPTAPGDLPFHWTGNAQTASAADAPVAGLSYDGYVAMFSGGASLRQTLDFSAAGLGDSVVTAWTLTFQVYNPYSDVSVSVGTGEVWPVPAQSWLTDFTTVSRTVGSDIYPGEQIVFDTSASGGQYTFIDNIRLNVLDTRPGGGVKTPTPTPMPTHTFTPTVTGTPPTPTPTPPVTETPTPEEEVGTPTPTPEVERIPVGIIVTANPSLLLLPVGNTEGTDPVVAGIQSLITVELVSEDGSRMGIKPDDTVDAELLETGTTSVGDVERRGPKDDGTYEFAFLPARPGMAVIRVRFVRDTDDTSYSFTEMVNVQVRKDRSGSVLGGDGTRRARLNPPKRPAVYVDIRR